MQDIESILQSLIGSVGDASLFGIPAALFFMIAVIFENPVIYYLESKYIISKYQVTLPLKETKFRVSCITFYDNHQKLYDFIVTLSKLVSYFLGLVFLFTLAGIIGLATLGIFVVILLYWVIKSPTLEKRMVGFAEGRIEGGILEL